MLWEGTIILIVRLNDWVVAVVSLLRKEKTVAATDGKITRICTEKCCRLQRAK